MHSSTADIVHNKGTLLIVDDNQYTAQYIESLVEDAGYQSVVIDSGHRALEVIRDQVIDLVLLDVVMPDIDGVDVARQIKEIAAGDFLPIILVTALCSDADKVKGLSHADDYLTKPFSGEELLARIQSLLRIRRLHGELYNSKVRYESLYENFPHLYISLDVDRKITNCNRFFRETFNVTKAEIIGKQFAALFSEHDRPVLDFFLNSITISSAPSVVEKVFSINQEHRSKPLLLSMKAVYTGVVDEELTFVIAMEDVTEQVRLQQEQKVARQQLYRSARLASIGTLASGVAHEINNPLTAILGFSSALLERIQQNESVDIADEKEYLGIINREALRCRDIVENLSKFAQEGDLDVVRVNLRMCVEDSCKLTHSKATHAAVNIQNNVDGSIEIIADPNKLEQVFVNIISNAIDFAVAETVVIIENVQAYDPLRFCTVILQDNGPGIDPKILPMVFDPFFTTKEVGNGTGMGLSICHKIMEECNGSINIRSEKGEGTRVQLNIPLGS